MFDGRLYHGVIPGRLGEGVCEPEPIERRVTLMVAFWEDINPQIPLGDRNPGASQPFPDAAKSTYTWHRPLQPAAWGTAEPSPAAVQSVGAVWQDVDQDSNREQGRLLASLTALPPYESCFSF